jgi:hypothetical protein
MSEANKKMFVMLVDIEAVNCLMADRDEWKAKFSRLAEAVEVLMCPYRECSKGNGYICQVCQAKEELVKIREGKHEN